jgi:hypothetical protein
MAPPTDVSKVFGVCGGLTTLAVCAVMLWNEFFSIDILTSMVAVISLAVIWLNSGVPTTE